MPDTNARLKNFYTKKGIGFIDNKNLKEAHLGKKKLHLNKTGNRVFAKMVLSYIKEVNAEKKKH